MTCNVCGSSDVVARSCVKRENGKEYPFVTRDCVPCTKARSRRNFAAIRADPERYAAHLAKKRAVAHSKGVTPLEERRAAKIRRLAFANILGGMTKAAGLGRDGGHSIRGPRCGEINWRRLARKYVARFGGGVDAASHRLRYHHDPDFRAKQIERTHKKNAIRKQRVEWASDGTLDGPAIRTLFALKACTYCDASMVSRDKTLDHIVPISRGGTHSIGNVCVCCRACNTSKAGRTLAEWTRGTPAPRGAPYAHLHPDARARRAARAAANTEANNVRMRSPEWKERCRIERASRGVA